MYVKTLRLCNRLSSAAATIIFLNRNEEYSEHGCRMPTYSVIITTYGKSYFDLRRAIDSATNQKISHFCPNESCLIPLPFEVIVVDDSHTDFATFLKVAEYYRSISQKHITRVYLPGEFISRGSCHVNIIVFTSKPNGGPASARNWGISLASGLWILPLDRDDFLDPYFLQEVIYSLSLLRVSIHDPKYYNVIMPALSNKDGVLTSWQPTADVSILLTDNVLHCCGLFLRAIWDNGIHYDETLLYGWEDWAFWIKVHTTLVIRPVIVYCSLYRYSRYHTRGRGQVSVSSFCELQTEICTALLHLSLPTEFSQITLKQDALLLYQKREILSRDHHWPLVVARTQPLIQDPFADLIFFIVSLQKNVTDSTLVDQYISQTGKTEMSGQYWYNIITNETRPYFHLIVTTKPSSTYWIKLLHHTISGILRLNVNSIIFIHTFFQADFTENKGFLPKCLVERIFVVPICNTWLAEMSGFGHIDVFIKQNAMGRPFYYSHFTDYYRYLLLFVYGGIYMDTDILLQRSVLHLHNALAWQDDDEVNGAFLSFDKGHPFMSDCLSLILDAYSPFNWDCIGPTLLTKLVLNKRNNLYDLNILHVSALYLISWRNATNLFNLQITTKEFELHPGFGSHIWNQLRLYNVTISSLSRVGRLLNATCYPHCMSCISTV